VNRLKSQFPEHLQSPVQVANIQAIYSPEVSLRVMEISAPDRLSGIPHEILKAIAKQVTHPGSSQIKRI